MAVSARWFINRFRSMSAAELGLRVRRAAAARVERSRVARGWSPGAGAVLEATRPLFAGQSAEDLALAWQESFLVDHSAAERLLNGQVTLFSRVYHVGRFPRWRCDPETRVQSPMRYGPAIDFRDVSLVGNVKVLWELGRHQYLVPLAVRYLVTGDRELRDAVVDQVDSWVADNPYAMGVHWSSAMEVALRGISWCVMHGLLALRDGEGGLLAASRDSPALVASIYGHGHFIRRQLSRHSSANNHLMGELVGLWCLARTFDFGATSRSWGSRARWELAREAQRQVHPDGVAREQAVHYQVEILEYLLLAWCVGLATGAPLGTPVRRAIESMTLFLSALRPVGGTLPQLGDSDDGLVLRFDLGRCDDPAAPVTEAAAQVLGPPEQRSLAPRWEKAFWYARMAAGRADVAAAQSLSIAAESPAHANGTGPLQVFREGGYAILRDAGLHLVFDAGPLGYLSIAAHGHADALAFCAAWHGRWWLVDPGTYVYQDDAAYRRYFRSTAAHNTVTVDGRDQSRQTGPFMWDRHARASLGDNGIDEERLWVAGHHDGYRRLGVQHRRRVEVCRATGRVQVTDELQVRGRPRRLELNFHFHPDVVLERTGDDGCRARRRDDATALRIDLDPACRWQTLRGSETPLRGWYSPAFGEKLPCWTLTGALEARDDVRLVVTFTPESARSAERAGGEGAA